MCTKIPREDSNFKQAYVLASGFKDGNNIIPVKLLIKEFTGKQANSLYVAMTLDKIKETAGQRTDEARQSAVAAFTMSNSRYSE